MKPKTAILLLVSASMIGGVLSDIRTARADTCLWEGRAPACNGECRPGYTLTRRDQEGDGKKCVTGTKAYCCLTSDIIIRGTADL